MEHMIKQPKNPIEMKTLFNNHKTEVKMKKSAIVALMVVAVCALNMNSFAAKSKLNKIHKQFIEKAEQMKKKGALAVVGVAVTDAGRIDVGKRKAIEMAKQEMSEQRKVYVESSTHDFMEEVGVGKNSENNDLFRQVIESVSVTILNGAEVSDFNYYATKENKKDGTATYLVLYVITPEAYQKSLEAELQAKGSKENLYQRYVDSEAKKKHDMMIKQYKDEQEKDETKITQ
jgi:hypothetical protein